MKPAIVLSGHTMGLGVARSLGEKGVPVVMMHHDERDMAQVSKFINARFWVPHPEKCQEEFIEFLVDKANRFGGGVLIPTSDEAVVAVSRNKKSLERHYLVACPEWEISKQFIDKKKTYRLADACGVPAPKTVVPKSVEEVQRYAENIEFPCLVKPCQSHLFFDRFKRKMYRVESSNELVDLYQQAKDFGLEVMLQEIIPGDDSHVVNYNAYCWGGRSLVEFTAAHIRNAPPWFGSPRVALSKEIPEVIEPGRKILQAMGFYGYACTEFKKDPRDGIYKLMEVNGRHNLSSLLAVRCGINFPWLEYQHLVQGDLPSACSYRTGVYWIDILRDVAYSTKYFAKEGSSLTQYIRPYLSPHVFAIFDLTDMRPFIKRFSFLAKKAFNHAFAVFQKPKKKVRDPGTSS
jgi:D-aspartate ligase